MTGGAFHHGDLRRALLDEAEARLREDGLETLSLRSLAAAAGVSHSAPRRHFPDRDALIGALAERGFTRLTSALRAALDAAPADPVERWTTVARAFVGFAAENPHLMDLAFTAKLSSTDPALAAAAGSFFAIVDESSAGTDERHRMLVAATLQGIAGLRASGRIDDETAEGLIATAAEVFVDRPKA